MENTSNHLYSHKMIRFTVLIILLSLPFLVKVADYDTWWHLVIGREIDRLSAIPETEFYIYTILGQRTSFPSWGFDLFYFTVYKYFGYYGMNIVNALIGGSVLYLLSISFNKQTIRTTLKIIFLCVTAFFMTSRMVHRPESFLYLFLAFEIFLLERYAENKNWKVLIPIPFLTFVISNLHTTAIFLIALFSVYFIQFLIEEKNQIERHQLKPLVVLLASTVLASCLNYYGFDQVLLLFKGLTQNHEMFNMTGEYAATLDTPYKYPFILFSTACLFSLTIKNNRKIAYFLLFPMFFILAYSYTRNIALFSIVMFVPTVKGFDAFFNLYMRNKPIVVNTLLTSFAMVLLLTSGKSIINRGVWGVGADLYNYPSRSVAKIKHLELNGNIFNLYRYGGYLAWELYDRHLVSIDGGRYSIDQASKVYDSILYMTDHWKPLLDSGDLNIIVLPTLNYNSEVFPIIHYLSKSNDWSIVEQDVFAFTFVRSSLLRNRVTRTLNKDTLWTDVIRKSAGFTDEKIKNINLGIAYYKLRQYNKSLKHLKTYQKFVPDDEPINFVITNLENGVHPVR